ncbi:MAG: IclR family transcriptional regulator [Halobacteriaceae archaeon]
MAQSHPDKRTVKAVANTLEIIKTIREQNGATVSELADRLELSASSVCPHLATLEEHGYVVQRGDTYQLGPQFLSLGDYVRNHYSIYRQARSEVDSLARETGECAHFIIEHQGREYTVYEAFGDDAVGMDFYVENREKPRPQLHCTAAGKAILAHLPDVRVEQIIADNGLPAPTDNTITDPDELRAELEVVRERGYAVNDEEEVARLRAVGSPILGANGEVLGSVSISAPTSRLDDEALHGEFAELVIEASNLIEIDHQLENGD